MICSCGCDLTKLDGLAYVAARACEIDGYRILCAACLAQHERSTDGREELEIYANRVQWARGVPVAFFAEL